MSSALHIGEEVRAGYGVHSTFDKWPVAQCQAKCAKHKDCKGFNYNGILGECRYKNSLDRAKTIAKADHSCWIYDSASVVPLTTRPPIHSTCDELSSCLGTTCDAQIEMNLALTCAKLEKFGCNCKNCRCVATTPATTVSPPYKWTQLKEADCVTTMSSALHIGEEVRAGYGVHSTFDKWPVAQCQAKCAKHKDCKGFNYNGILGECRYKNSLDRAKTIAKADHSCWIYGPDATTPAFKFDWLEETGNDCASKDYSSNVAIGDHMSPRGGRQTFDVASIDKCKRKCAQHKECDGFNYEFEQNLCRYKKGISTHQLLPDENHNCYVYMRTPENTPKPVASGCVDKTGCLNDSCDGQIAKQPALTCALLEGMACNCNGCACSAFGHDHDTPVVAHGRNLRVEHSDS